MVRRRAKQEHGHDPPPEGTKLYAQPRDEPPRPAPFYVYDADDWHYMHTLKHPMVCPDEHCRIPLVAVENDHGTRFMRSAPGVSHHPRRGRGVGGYHPMTQEHRWFQRRLAAICDHLGYPDVGLEDPSTRGDVIVPTAQFVLEVQRSPTGFDERTDARSTTGFNTIWFMPARASGQLVQAALRELPAVRVEARVGGGVVDEPWADPATNREARLYVWGTVGRLSRDGLRVETGRIDAYKFLREVLSRHRVWYPPGTPHLSRPGGAWVRRADMERIRTMHQQRSLPAPPPPPTFDVPAVPVAADTSMLAAPTPPPILSPAPPVVVATAPDAKQSRSRPRWAWLLWWRRSRTDR